MTTPCLALIAAGDPEGFAILEREHGWTLRALARRFKQLDADDSAADIQVILWKAAGNFDPERDGASERAYICAVAINCLRDAARKQKRRATQMPEVVEEGLLDRRESSRPDRGMEARDELDKAMVHFAWLSEHHRTAIDLIGVRELSYEGFAKSQQVNIGTVKSRLFHARARLAHASLNLIPVR